MIQGRLTYSEWVVLVPAVRNPNLLSCSGSESMNNSFSQDVVSLMSVVLDLKNKQTETCDEKQNFLLHCPSIPGNHKGW